MRISIEAFAAVNLCMDTISLLAACRALSPARVRYGRVLLAAVLGTAYAFIRMSLRVPLSLAIPAFCAVSYIMAAIAIPSSHGRGRLRACAVLIACSVLMGGACAAVQRVFDGTFAVLFCGACVSILLMMAVWRAHQSAKAAAAAVITCEYAGRQARMRALIDTGNRLCDPLTGLPVIAAPCEALGELLPPGVDPCDPGTMPPGFRLLRAQTAAGPCLLMCFHPHQLMIEYEGKCFFARALIAVSAASEGSLALMPSELLVHQSAAGSGVQS